MPLNRTGAGMNVRVVNCASIGKPSMGTGVSPSCSRLLSQSKLYQSSRPWKYSSAASTFSLPAPSAVEHANEYSRRAGCQASPSSSVVCEYSASNQSTKAGPAASAAAASPAESPATPSDARFVGRAFK